MTIFALEYLRETQTEADLLIIDDHSVDGTVDFLVKKGYSVLTKSSAKGLTDSWNEGYEIAVGLGYKYLIFTNNDVLVSAAGVRIMRQELRREVLVVPLTSAKGAGHNPSQSLVSAYRLPEASEDYVGNYRHFELIQAALSRIARNTSAVADPQDKTKRFSRLVSSLFRGKARFNGFFFGMNLALIAPAAVRHPALLFDSGDLMVGQEDHLMERLAAKGLTPKIAICVFIYHFKSVTVGVANIKALTALQLRDNDSNVSYSRTGRNFRIKKELLGTNGSTLSSVHMDIRDDLRFYHPEFTPTSSSSNSKSPRANEINAHAAKEVPQPSSDSSVYNAWSAPAALLAPPSYPSKKEVLAYPDLYLSYKQLQTDTEVAVFPGPLDMVAVLRERVTNNMVNAQNQAGSEAGSEDNGSSSAVAALDTLKSLQHIARLEREAANEAKVVIGFAISDPLKTPSAGDIFTAQELGDALTLAFNVEVRYLRRGQEWYSPSALADLDVLVTMLDAFDLGRALAAVQRNTAESAPHSTLTSAKDRRRSVKSSLVAVAWMRNWFQRWLTRPWVGNYDLLLGSSPSAQDFVRRIGSSVGFQVQCVMGCPVVRSNSSSSSATREDSLVNRRVSVPIELLPLATNAAVFHARNVFASTAASKYRADYVFSGSYHGVHRSVMSFDPGALLPRWKGLVVGEGWDERPGGANVSSEWRKAAVGRVPYEDMSEVYHNVKIVVDDANHVTRPWGSVNSRVFDAIAAGALVVTNGRHGFQTIFGSALREEGGEELRVPLFYSSGLELEKVLEYYLSHETERTRLVRDMQRVVLGKHTYEVRAQQMSRVLAPFGVTLQPALAVSAVPESAAARRVSEKVKVDAAAERFKRVRPQKLPSVVVKKSFVDKVVAQNFTVSLPPTPQKKRRLRGPAGRTSSTSPAQRRSMSGSGGTNPADKALVGRTSLCVGVRTIESQLGWLEILVRSLMLQYLGSHYSTQIEMLLFVINTDQDTPSGRFHSQLKSMARRTNAEYGVKIAHVLSDSPLGPQQGGAQRAFRNPFYGYDSTDFLVAHMLALNARNATTTSGEGAGKGESPSPSCEWIMLTNGDNTYNAAWFGTVASRLLNPSLDAVAWDYVTHHKRGKQLDTTETAVTVELKRGFVDLGSAVLRSRLYAASSAMFLSEAVFTRDLFARDYFTFMRALNGVKQSAIELGFKLAVTDTGVPALSAREARLKAFGNVEGPHKQPAPKPSEPTLKLSSEDVDEDEALAKALAMSAAEVNAPTPVVTSKPSAKKVGEDADYLAAEAEQDALDQQAAVKAHSAMNDDWDGEEMVPVPVDESILSQLVDMGFPDIRARKSIVHGSTLDGALAWLGDHQDDADIDQPYMVKKSDTIPKVPLTEEEKAVRMQAIKDRVKQRREEKVKQARADEIRLEKERRERGSKIDETLEERQRMQRKREADKMKKEKDDANNERNRLRAEIARDKELRKLNKGVLPSVLGVDGYNPSAIQYSVPNGTEGGEHPPAAPTAAAATAKPSTTTSAPAPVAKSSSSSSAPASTPSKKAIAAAAAAESLDPAQKVDNAIAMIARYRTGGDGGAALKLLLTFVKNIVDSPAEAKFRSINTEGAAFKSRLMPLVGPMILLRAVGFEKSEEDGKLKFDGPADSSSLIASTAVKLTQAEALYRQQNGL
eukprot:gene22401-28523_t